MLAHSTRVTMFSAVQVLLLDVVPFSDLMARADTTGTNAGTAKSGNSMARISANSSQSTEC